ncbi:MAG: hypothetical protein EXR75_04945 [Myxococcales bacterium]|nr:hypothetical protein [Myxococcales bacterium]
MKREQITGLFAVCATPALARVVVAIAVVAGCGGSASETPWPVQPVGSEQGPAGEAADRRIELGKLPNRYGEGGAKAEEPPADGDAGQPERTRSTP